MLLYRGAVGVSTSIQVNAGHWRFLLRGPKKQINNTRRAFERPGESGDTPKIRGISGKDATESRFPCKVPGRGFEARLGNLWKTGRSS